MVFHSFQHGVKHLLPGRSQVSTHLCVKELRISITLLHSHFFCKTQLLHSHFFCKTQLLHSHFFCKTQSHTESPIMTITCRQLPPEQPATLISNRCFRAQHVCLYGEGMVSTNSTPKRCTCKWTGCVGLPQYHRPEHRLWFWCQSPRRHWDQRFAP